jgi:O-antigen/teichoic acid export membrane protein
MIIKKIKDYVLGDTVLLGILKNSSWLFGANSINAGIGLLHVVLISRALGVEKYGIFALITTFISVIAKFIDSRSWETGIKYVTEFYSSGDQDRALSVLKLGYIIDISASIVSFLLSWVFAVWFSKLFFGSTMYYAEIHTYSFVLLANWNSGAIVLFRVFNRFDLSAKLDVTIKVMQLLGIVAVLYVLNGGIIYLLFVYVITTFLNLIIGLILVRKLLKHHFSISLLKVSLNNLKGHGKSILHFLLNTNFTALLKIFQQNGAVLILGFLSTPLQVGYFKLAQSLAGSLGLFYTPVFQAIYPDIVKLWMEKKIRKLRAIIAKFTYISALAGILILIFVWFFGENMISLLSGEEFRLSSQSLLILTLANIIALCTIWIGPLFLASGNAQYRSIAHLIGGILMVLCLVTLIPKYGASGAAIGSLCFYMGWLSFSVIKIKRMFQNIDEITYKEGS